MTRAVISWWTGTDTVVRRGAADSGAVVSDDLGAVLLGRAPPHGMREAAAPAIEDVKHQR